MVSRIQPLSRLLAVSILGALATGLGAHHVSASETRSYVVSWVYYANASEDGDCPDGLNDNAEKLFRRILRDRNTPPAEVEKLMAAFPDSANDIEKRAVLNGKPVSAYLHPTASKDPMLKIMKGHKGFGFNLDGRDGPDDFVDLETGERGVDNQFFRAIGCSIQLRSAAGQIGSFQVDQWDELRDNQPAWLIEISGIDSAQDDDDVEIRVVQAEEITPRDVTGAPRTGMTFRPNPIPRTDGNVAHAKIKNGRLTTDKFNFYMPGDPFAQADYAFRDARMRFTFQPDGTLKGIIGGYQYWRTIAASWGLGGVARETMVSYDVPGLYYALRKMADAYPDPKTGVNGYISSTYAIDAIPAFINKAPKAQPPKPKVLTADTAPLATPPGIIFKTHRLDQQVTSSIDAAKRAHPTLFFADAANLPLYTYNKDEPGKSNCSGECAVVWRPALAPADAKPMGDWALISRVAAPLGAQWAFQGRPLYTYAKDAEAVTDLKPDSEVLLHGERGGGGAALGQGVDGAWYVVDARPKPQQLPAAMSVTEVLMAPGQVLINAEGKTIYMFNGRANDKKGAGVDWLPVVAPQLAMPIGEFTVVAGADGVYQWALRGKPLYTYKNDWTLGDASGRSVDRRFEVAIVVRYFMPPNVGINQDPRRGGIMVTTDTGRTLYARDAAGDGGRRGHNTRGVRSSPATGLAIGVSGCADAQCENTWQPLKASANARPSGYWSIYTRPDGSRQWAYQNFAVYTYAEDGPGQINGHDIFDMTINDTTEGPLVSNLGLFWRVVSP